MAIVTGSGPQLKVMMPPAATALTTAAEVQLAGVPVPILRVGWLVSTALAAAGMLAWPFGLPGFGRLAGLREAVGEADAEAEADGVEEGEGEGAAADEEGNTKAAGFGSAPHPASNKITEVRRATRRIRTGRC
jgi:hypothetical protein